MSYKHSIRFSDLPRERAFRPDKLPGLAARLWDVITKLESLGVRVADFGRLRAAHSTLVGIGTAGRFEDDEAGLRRSAEAIRLAQDFVQIGETISPDDFERIARELEHALKGSLVGNDKTRKPFQFQSQFWYGAALSRAGLNPRVPSLSGSTTPDFIVRPFALSYAVEVKRPTSRSGALESLRKASDQLSNSGHHGVIALDLSDCLDDLGLRRIVATADDWAHEDIKPAYRNFCDSLTAAAWNAEQRQHEPGYSSVFGIWFFARGWRWVSSNLEQPQLIDMQGFQSMVSRKGNVWHHVANEFFRMMLVGLRDSGMHVFAAEHETYDARKKPFWEEPGASPAV